QPPHVAERVRRNPGDDPPDSSRPGCDQGPKHDGKNAEEHGGGAPPPEGELFEVGGFPVRPSRSRWRGGLWEIPLRCDRTGYASPVNCSCTWTGVGMWRNIPFRYFSFNFADRLLQSEPRKLEFYLGKWRIVIAQMGELRRPRPLVNCRACLGVGLANTC